MLETADFNRGAGPARIAQQAMDLQQPQIVRVDQRQEAFRFVDLLVQVFQGLGFRLDAVPLPGGL